MRRLFAVLAPIAVAACAEEPPPVPIAPLTPSMPANGGSSATALAETPPTLRLPSDTRPLSEKLTLHVAPDQARFSGTADILVQLDVPRRTVWLHGKGLHVARATLTPDGQAPLAATWAQVDDHGTASVTLDVPAPAGKATLHLEYDAAVSDGRTGLFRATEGNVPYLFTQLEAIYARAMFPCFDEPGFKIPWSLILDVPAGAQVVANTPEAERTPAPGGGTHVRFAATKPLPS